MVATSMNSPFYILSTSVLIVLPLIAIAQKIEKMSVARDNHTCLDTVKLPFTKSLITQKV